jgi:hypothetical protein
MNGKEVEKHFVGSAVQWETAFSRESTTRKRGAALSRHSTDMVGKRLFIGKNFRQGR